MFYVAVFFGFQFATICSGIGMPAQKRQNTCVGSGSIDVA